MEAAMLIGGEWRQAASSEEIEVVNPATEEVVGSVPSADVADVELAVATAQKAFPAWAATDVEERAHVLAKAAELIKEHAGGLAALLTSEQGKPVAEARGEVTHLAHGVRYYAEAATKVRGAHQELPSTLGRSYGMVIRRPMGVCAAITPYNFPLTLLGTKVAPALATGNTVVAKPASTTPLATLEVARLFAEAGVPDGVLNVVTGRGATIGDALVGHPDVRRIAFTGETATGRHLMSIAGPALKRVTLELGGSDPVIVCADADVDAAVKAVIIGRYWNAGQACLGCKRVFVADAVFDDFTAQLVERVGRYEPGDGTVKAEKPRLRMGPIHTRRARDELVDQLQDGVAKGGELLIGGGTAGHDKGWFLEPAVVAEPGADSRLVTEEVFGPVLPIFRFTELDDALARANDTPYGLGSSIWTHDVRNINRAAQEIDAGMTWVNQIHYGYDELPFGGIKDSGFGKEHGLEALDSYVELKSVVVGGSGLMAVTYAADGRVGTITLDNPPANSYDIEMVVELGEAIDEAAADATARVVVVRSSSERFFCAGADIKAFLANDIDANMEMIRTAHTTLGRIAAARQAFVAWIAGHALGGGLEIALACDLRYALAGEQRLGTPEVSLGLLPGNGGTQRLTRQVGRGPALELLLTGRQVTPDEAQALGLVGRVFADEAAFDEHVARLAAGPPMAIAAIKRCVHVGGELSFEHGLELERQGIEQLFRSQDAIEGLTAFVEKRAPEFVGA